MKGGKILTGIRDCYGKPIPYGALLDFIWWARGLAGEVELHYKARGWMQGGRLMTDWKKACYEWTIVRQFYKLGCIAGAEWQKSQMLKNVVKGQIYGSDCDHIHWVESEIYENPKWKEGDKVRIIVIKDESK